MYDLSLKDKPRSAFIRLRERMRARKRNNDEESSSAIVPGGYGVLTRVRGRLPSDGGGEEDYEDDEGGELRRSKMRNYFLYGRLRKSSDTRSSTSLCSESSESSSRGGSLSPTAGISVVVSDLSNSPSNSSNLTADNSPEQTVAPSPQVSPDRHLFYDEACDASIPLALSATTNVDGLILLPSVCVNGNPVETSPLTHQPPSLILQQPKPQIQIQQEPTKTPPQTSPPEKAILTGAQTAQPSEPKHPPGPEPQVQPLKAEFKPSRPEHQFPALGVLQKGSPLSLSLQNLSRRGEEQQGGGPLDGRRWSFDKPGEKEKAAIAAELEHVVFVADDAVEATGTVSETEVHSKKRRGLFSHGRVESAGKGQGAGKDETGHTQNIAEGKQRGWFTSKDTYSKPSQLVSHQNDFTTITLSSLTPSGWSHAMADQQTNPFTSPPFPSPDNPFFSTLQQNPFFQELHTVAPLTPALPSFFSPDHCQLEAPPSFPCNPTPFVDLAKTGSTKGCPVDEAPQMSTMSDKIDLSGDGYVSPIIYTEWDEFIDDRLKTLEDLKDDTQKMTTLPPSQIKSTDQTCADGSFTLSNMDDTVVNVNNISSSGTLIADDLSSFTTLAHLPGSKANYLSSNTCNTEICNNFVTQEAPESVCGSSLLQNLNMESSELNALAYPSSALLSCSVNKDKASAVSETELSQLPSQYNASCSELSIFPGSPEASTHSNASLDYLGLIMNEKPEHDAFKCISSQILIDDDTAGSAKTHETSVLYCRDLSSDDALEPSTVMTSGSLGRDHDILAPKSLQTGLSHFKPEDSTTASKGEPQLKESVIEDGSCLDASLPALNTEPLQFCTFMPKSEALVRCDPTHEAIPVTNEAILKCLSADMMLTDSFVQEKTMSKVDALQEVMGGPEKETVKLDPQIRQVDNESNPSEPHSTHHVQPDASAMATYTSEGPEVFTESCQSTESIHGSDFVSEKTSSITQDAVITNLLMENNVLPHHAGTHTVDTSPIAHTVPVETFINAELCPDPTETSDRSIKTQTAATAAVSNPMIPCLDSSTLWPFTVQPPELPTGNEPNLNSPFLLLDSSPLAFSTPHEAVDTDVLPLFSFPIKGSAPTNSLLNTVQDSAPILLTQPDPYSKEFHQVSRHLSSPHPVKPLTPPDEKKSEGRSVLEKLKSTIHPGRGHHGDQELEKKPLVEGGGSYYHLNHSELVSLLLQRDTELQDEREEYERRGVLLEKREVEIKKMKFLIRDLEDYIDTLLVRIMEQTPALLQVRPKMK
ncbi:uncharacterized protein rab11fip5a isoform X2 [Electrophorus electricus]|nr:uncharacterized protein rab11fip5a isoform X2 [Electrophorus electricus]